MWLLALSLILNACQEDSEFTPDILQDSDSGVDSGGAEEQLASAYLPLQFLDSGSTESALGFISGDAYEVELLDLSKSSLADDPELGINITSKWITGRDTAHAFCGMFNLARQEGFPGLQIESGFRSDEEQSYFWNCYQNCNCNDCNVAAKPGTSNHQNGIAIDIKTCPSCKTAAGEAYRCCDVPEYRWLLANAWRFGFKDTVTSEAWHFEHLGGNATGDCCDDVIPDTTCRMGVLPVDQSLPPELSTSEHPGLISGKVYDNIRGTTWQSGCSQFNRYSCAPDKDESGPEAIYAFRIEEPGLVRIAVTPDDESNIIGNPAMDADIHLLSSLSANHCLARDDETIGPLPLDAGVYYIAVDTFVEHSPYGAERPLLSTFELSVRFDAESNSECKPGCLGHYALQGDCSLDDCTSGGGSCQGGSCTNLPAEFNQALCTPFCFNNVAYDEHCLPTDCDSTPHHICQVDKAPRFVNGKATGLADFSARCRSKTPLELPAHTPPFGQGSSWPESGQKASDAPLCEPGCLGQQAQRSDCTLATCALGTLCTMGPTGEPSCLNAEGDADTCTPHCTGKILTQADCSTIDCGAQDDTQGCIQAGEEASCGLSCEGECEGKLCGDDGCGGSCGLCPYEGACQPDGQSCVCAPTCLSSNLLLGSQCLTENCGTFGALCQLDTNTGESSCVLPCSPDCSGKACGDDGCGGSCGDCPLGGLCSPEGTCACQPACAGEWIIEDDCSQSINCASLEAQCVVNEFTLNPECVATCTPNCISKSCGDDGCGGSCGACPNGGMCAAQGTCACQPACAGEWIIEADCSQSINCATFDAECVINELTMAPECILPCSPDCEGKSCGDDGCGGSCGACPNGGMCAAQGTCACQPTCAGEWIIEADCSQTTNCASFGAECVINELLATPECVIPCAPDCTGKTCGSDGCGGSCGTCPNAGVCLSNQTCCEASCDGKICGSDGCGGSCGECPHEGECAFGVVCYCEEGCAGSWIIGSDCSYEVNCATFGLQCAYDSEEQAYACLP